VGKLQGKVAVVTSDTPGIGLLRQSSAAMVRDAGRCLAVLTMRAEKIKMTAQRC
jgi:hypothetical protein